MVADSQSVSHYQTPTSGAYGPLCTLGQEDNNGLLSGMLTCIQHTHSIFVSTSLAFCGHISTVSTRTSNGQQNPAPLGARRADDATAVGTSPLSSSRLATRISLNTKGPNATPDTRQRPVSVTVHGKLASQLSVITSRRQTTFTQLLKPLLICSSCVLVLLSTLVIAHLYHRI